MVIGLLKLPNKWAITASVENKPFVYRSNPPIFTDPTEQWGNAIRIDPWFNIFKIICQDAYRITEYWCVCLTDGIHDKLLVPIVMKQYGCSNMNTTNCFLFKNGIFDLLVETNKSLPNFNRAYLSQYGYAECVLECLTDGSGMFQPWSQRYTELSVQGATELRFASGRPMLIDHLIRHCTPVEMYAHSMFRSLNECGDLQDIGIQSSKDLIDFFRSSLPVNQVTGIMDVDWIGECILSQNLTNFEIEAINQSVGITPNSANLMHMLKEVVNREELIDIPNYTTNTILEDYAISNFDDQRLERVDSSYTDIQETIDSICTLFMTDEATTNVIEYDLRVGTSDITDRVYGYGLASAGMFQNGAHQFKHLSEIDFFFRALLDALNAWKIRCIKTFNEELFITIEYNGGAVRSYYINLVVHACVSGCLFSA